LCNKNTEDINVQLHVFVFHLGISIACTTPKIKEKAIKLVVSFYFDMKYACDAY